jgi:hypothetical protein
MRLLILSAIAGIVVLFYPRVLSPLRGNELVPAALAVSVVVVLIHRLTRGR